MANKQQDKALQNALEQIEKKFGKGAIMQMDNGPIQKIDVISTGSLLVDEVIGIGGIPRGRITEIYGPESSGKTTLTLHIIAEAQKMGLRCAFIDAEQALDLQYASNLGVNIQELILSQPDAGEDGLEIVNMLASSGAVGLIVIDSVSALVPRAEISGEIGDASIGLQARMMSQALRMMTGNVGKSNTSVIFINQLREKIGVMFGSPETTSGGRALKFFASLRLDVRGTKVIKRGTDIVGKETTVKVVKNKLAPPFRKAETQIAFGRGFDINGEIIDLALRYKLIQRSGAWYTDGEIRLGNGKENAKDYLIDNPEYKDALKQKVKESMSMPIVKNSVDLEEDEDEVSGF